MKLGEIFRYEVEHRMRSGSTWGYFLFLFLVAIWMFLATADGEAIVNTPERISGGIVLPGLLGILVSAALFGSAAVRDTQTGMDALLFSAPLQKAEFLGGRFLAALAVNSLLLLAIPLGSMAATGLSFNLDPESVGPFLLGAYVQGYSTFLLPNLVFVGSVLFAVGALARQMIPVYLAAIGFLISYVVALNYTSLLEDPLFAALADPLGVITLQTITRYWSELERETQLVGLPGMLALNRAIWLLMAGVVFAMLHRVFQFGTSERRGVPKTQPMVTDSQVEAFDMVNVPRVPGEFDLRMHVLQTFAIARNSLAEVAASRWFVVVVLACVGMPLLWGWNVGDSVFDTSTWPVTLLITEEVLASRSTPLFMVIVILFSGELVWKEREVGAAEIGDSAPLAHGIALLGQFLALVAIVLIVQSAAMVGGILIQALQGYFKFEPGLYLRVVFGLKFADYVLLGALSMAIHVFVNHKNLGHMVTVMAIALTALATPLLGISHHLLLYGTYPDWTYSDMNGFGPFAKPAIWFVLYWSAWAVLLLIAAALFQDRGLKTTLRHRIRHARARLNGGLRLAVGAVVTLILAIGGLIFYNTNILNDYRTVFERDQLQADYEIHYGQYEELPQPIITAAELRVEIYPEQRSVDISGRYTLVNQTNAAINSVHVSLPRNMETHSISFNRAAETEVIDREVGYSIYILEQSLAPGDSVDLTFDVRRRSIGFTNDSIHTDLVANGTNFNRMLTPMIGYQPILELSNETVREHHGLLPHPPVPGPEEAASMQHRWAIRDSELVHIDALIGTSADQTAVTSGSLKSSWTDNNRQYFHYQTEQPVSFGFSVFSAEYAVLEDRWNEIALKIFHHPEHEYSLDRMLKGMKSSLEYLTAEFGPYPYSELSIVEIPLYGNFGSAHPSVVAFSEAAFFSRVKEGEVDQPFYGTAHEVAHTWWGGMVRGAPVRGAALLSESLANYSAMMITEREYGPEAGSRVYDFQMERYLRGRATQGGEVPALDVQEQPYIAYRKGAIALYTLREHIGEEAVNGAIRRYSEKFSNTGAPYPTSLDLYSELRAVTPDSLQPMLTDWFETITLWEVKTERAVAERIQDGQYVVRLDVIGKKTRADDQGRETEIPMDDLVEIGVFASSGENNGLGEVLYLQKHRIRTGDQTISVTVPSAPSVAGIDPRRRLVDRERGDNIRTID